jgi:hypothetical protein
MWRWYYWGMWIVIASFVLGFLIKPFLIYIWIPIKSHRKHPHDVECAHEPADLETMSPEARQQLERVLAQFREEGFEPIGPPLARTANEVISSVQTILINSKGDIGEIFSTSARSNALVRSQTFVVRSKFEDGSQVATVSSRSPGVFPRDPTRDVANFHWVKDAHTLCEAHRRRMSELGFHDRTRVAPRMGEHEAFEKEEGRKEMNRVAARGYYYFDEKARVYRKTWKGSFLMSWKLSTPWRQWRMGREDRRAQQAWRDLGMDQWRLGVPAATAVERAPAPVSQVQYEPQLPEGEVHTHAADGVLTVRIGMQSRGKFLARQWLQYYAIVTFGFMIGSMHYFRWLYARGRPMTPRGTLIYCFWWAVIVWAISTLIIGLIRRRGTVTLVASPRGLTYRNILALRGEGELDREEIKALLVVVYKLGLRGRTYQLLLSGEMRDQYTLALGKDKKELERVRDLITEALGVKEQVAAPAPA